MGNADARAAHEYHDRTKHSVASVRANAHVLDWANQPIPFKLYEELDPIALPRDWEPSTTPALDALASPGAGRDHVVRPDVRSLARVLHLTAGITKKTVYPNGKTQYFRAAACTGALYHIDLYVICGALDGLDAGVYHFGPHDFSLRRLRGGDHRGAVVDATARESSLLTAPVMLVSASTFWRNAWKYQTRAYRHVFWDAGTMHANLLAAAVAAGIPARVVLGFTDATIHALLGLDAAREAAVTVVALGHDPRDVPPPAPPAAPLALATKPLSAHEVDYPAIRAANEASSLTTADDVAAWRDAVHPLVASPSATTEDVRTAEPPDTAEARTWFPLEPLGEVPSVSIDDVIQRRGSTRQFAYRAITFGQLSTMLLAATGDVDADVVPQGTHLADAFLIVHAVNGLPSGAYVYDRRRRALALIATGDFREKAGFLGLGQELPADASVNVYLLADLDRVLSALGNRGYRAAQLDAAITGGKLYLAAYALGLGATGLTFFDDSVIEFFAPAAAGKSVMFLVAIGVPRARRPRVR